uniref:CSC1-like protein n=1 Tax=Chenopodium quinoa TaxID=63459 RepID=A0A803N3L4_CHEQI
MADLQDIGISAAVNLLTALIFLIAFAIFRLQPINDRVYFPKWYLKGTRASPPHSKGVNKVVNLDFRMYLRFLNWMPEALRMPEPELIEHAGLDSVAYIRIYLLGQVLLGFPHPLLALLHSYLHIGLKIFIPIAVVAFAVLIPVNWTGKMLEGAHDLTFSNIDKLSISNIPWGSNRTMLGLRPYTLQILGYVTKSLEIQQLALSIAMIIFTDDIAAASPEYGRRIGSIPGACNRLYFVSDLAQPPGPIWFSTAAQAGSHCVVLLRNVPPDPDESVSEHVEHFFYVNHPDHYLLHQVVYNANKLAKLVDKKKSLENYLTYYQNKYERKPSKKPTIKTGFCGLWGTREDAIDYYAKEIEKLSEQEAAERARVLSDPEAILPAAFVSFKNRWGAAVCAQTQQTRNPTVWLTEWAPEPSDVYWDNLAIPYVELKIRRLLMAIALFFLIFFYMVPITFVQSLANINGIEKVFPFLKHLVEKEVVTSFIQGYIPGIILKIFLLLIPMIIMFMNSTRTAQNVSASAS